MKETDPYKKQNGGKKESAKSETPIPLVKSPAANNQDADPCQKEKAVSYDHEGSFAKTLKKWAARQAHKGRCYLGKPTFTDWVVAVATIFIALANWYTWGIVRGGSVQTDKMVTAAQHIETVLQKANRQNRDAIAKTLAQSKKAMEASNKESRNALHASVVQSQLDERAWIVLKGIAHKPELGKPWNLEVIFSNTGKTPARFVKESCNLVSMAGAVDAPRTFKLFPYGSASFVAPGSQHFCVLAASHGITKADLAAIRDRKFTVFVYGAVLYEDVFGDHHWLTFCQKARSDLLGWNPCESHNDTGDGRKPPD